MSQRQETSHEERPMQKRFVLLMVIILPMIGGAIIWILNIQGLITGPWSSIFSVVFTVLGALVAFLQWHQQALTSRPPESLFSSMPRQRLPSVHLKETNLGVSRRKGALLVKVKGKFVGSTVNLCRGFDNPHSSVDVAASVVLRRINGSPTYVAIFTTLDPGNYTVSLHSPARRANVTIQADQIAEIDWRRAKRASLAREDH